jgi:hypothetical protein
MDMLPIVLIALGVLVLVLGRRLSVLGAAVGALLGVVILRLFPGIDGIWVELLVVLGLAALGFFFAAFAGGIIDIVILVIGALAGAGIVLAILDLFNLDLGLTQWLAAVIGAVVGFIVIRRARRGGRDWGMIILSSLVGALLIMRGLYLLFPSLNDTLISTLLLVALLAVSIIYQGGFLSGRKAKPAVATTPAPLPPAPPVDKQPPQDQA